MKEIGEMIGQMDMEYISIRMELDMKETGGMISNTVKESKLGMTGVGTLATTWMARSTAKDITNGMMVQSTRENGKKTKYLD